MVEKGLEEDGSWLGHFLSTLKMWG